MNEIRGNKRIIRAWTMYDWANSVYQLSITSAILPAYYHAVTSGNGSMMVDFFGFKLVNTTLYAWAVSVSFLMVAILSPFLSAVADYTGRRKLFMQIFTWIGSLSCMGLYFFTSDKLELGIIFFVLAGFGYSGSLVFYNSWLPEIAPKGLEDRISARGYALGYLGGVILLIANLLLILNADALGINDKSLPARISFISVGIWWLGFSQITFLALPKYTRKTIGDKRLLLNGYIKLKTVFLKFMKTPELRIYIFAFFFMMTAVLTVMYMAANFGKKEIGLEDNVLIPTILIIQLVGIAGSIGFARLSEKLGNIYALLISIVIWIGICWGAYIVRDAKGFMLLAAVVGLVMGGIQALARSTYARLIPSSEDNTSYFSFIDVAEKLAVVFGTFSFGLIETITGSMRASIALLSILFVLSFVLLFQLRNNAKLKP